MRPYVILTAGVAVAALLASLLAGSFRRAAVVGSTTASVTAIASLVAMARVSRVKKNSVKGPLAVMVITFLGRMLLVGLGTILVVRAGESIVGFVVAFFVPYFAFAVIEAAFVHALSRLQGHSA